MTIGEVGVIEAPFGKSGKFKVRFDDGRQKELGARGQLRIRFKKFIFHKTKQLVQ